MRSTHPARLLTRRFPATRGVVRRPAARHRAAPRPAPPPGPPAEDPDPVPDRGPDQPPEQVPEQRHDLVPLQVAVPATAPNGIPRSTAAWTTAAAARAPATHPPATRPPATRPPSTDVPHTDVPARERPAAGDPGLGVRGFAVAAGVVLAGVLVFCLLSTSGVLSERASVVLDNAGQFFGGASATVACLWSWRRCPPPDRTWRLLLGLGAGGWTCGLTAWAWFQIVVGHELPSPSVADIGFFMLPLFALPALYLFPARQRHESSAGVAGRRPYAQLVFVLDSLVVVGSLFVLTWSTALGAAVRTGEQNQPQLLIALGYPITDLMLVVFVVLLATFRAPLNSLSLLLLGLGLIGFSVSDSLYLWLVSTGAESMPPLYNIGFVAGPALVALGVLAPNLRPPPDRTGTEPGADRGAVLLPYLPLTATGLLLVWKLATGRPVDPVEGVIGLGLVVLVVGRQLVTLLDNVSLLRQVREGQERLRRQAYHDDLTGLANRAMFAEELDRAVRAHRDDQVPLALVFCDLDDFKLVNDRYGHAAGDELLRAVAGRLRNTVRRPGLAARLGGDEFAVLLTGEAPAADAVARRVLETLIEPYELGVPDVAASVTVSPGASIGLVVLDADEPAVSADTLLARVDAAMYAAKRRGKNRLVTFSSQLLRQFEEPALLGELRLAITTGQREAGRDVLAIVDGAGRPATGVDPGRIAVMYQPVVRLGTTDVVAVEALVRWQHPRHGLLPADMLVSAADDADLLTELEEHVLDLACRDIKQLRTRPGLEQLAVHVNLSATRAGDPLLVRTVRETLVRHGLPGEALVLEITETSRVPELHTAAWVLQQIRRLQVRLALDDFGTGYSGLSYLLELPIDIVKLDRSLTVAGADSRGGTIRNAAAALTMGLGLDLIAEGVETPRQAELVAGLGCQFGQGYLWSRPAFLADLDLSGRPVPELVSD